MRSGSPSPSRRRGFDHRDAVGQVQRGAEAVGQPRLDALAAPRSGPPPRRCRGAASCPASAASSSSWNAPSTLTRWKPCLRRSRNSLLVFALPVADDRGQQIGAGALGHRHHGIDHVLHLHRGDRQAGGGRIGRADAGEQQAQVVVDLGHRADGGARVLRGGLLFDGNRGRQARDVVHIRLAHHVEELPRIGRQRFRHSAAGLRHRSCRRPGLDLPDPDSPVITTSWSRGMSTSTLLRLCSRAPRTSMNFCSAMAAAPTFPIAIHRRARPSLQSEYVNRA